MASHLTVTTAANPGVAKGLQAQANASAPTDAFAALLGQEDHAEPAQAARPAPTTAAPPADGVTEPARDEPSTDVTPDAVAAPIVVPLPIQQPVTPETLLAGVIDGLTALRTAAQNGQTPSADDLAKLSQGLDALAQALGVTLDQLPSMDELAAMATQPLPPGGTVEAQLISTLAPVAQDVLTQAANTTTTNTALADQLKAVGDKIAALLKSLNDGAVKLGDLVGSDPTAPSAADLQAALDRLLKPAAAPMVAAPAFTAPTLETAQPVLAGKAAEPAAAIQPTEGASTASGKSDVADPVLKVEDNANPDKADNAGEQRDKLKDTRAEVVAAAAKTVPSAPDAPTPVQAGIHTATRLEATPGPRPVIAGYQTSQQQLNLPQIAFELVRQVNDGHSRFQMRLDPPELGKIDVRLDIDRSGQVTARLTVEKAETLDLMQRDQRGLEKALQQAGLDSSKTNLEFSLKQNPFGGGQQGQNAGGRSSLFGGDSSAEAEEPAPQINLYRASLSASGVNIIA